MTLRHLCADGTLLELMHHLGDDVDPAPLPTGGDSVEAAALARGSAVRRGSVVATSVRCDHGQCVLAAFAAEGLDAGSEDVIDAIAATYAAGMARCNAEQRLAENESRLQLMLDQIPAIVSTLDTNLVFTSAQGAGTRVMPPAGSQLVGRTLADVIGTGEGSAPVKAARAALAGNSNSFEWTWLGRSYENWMEPLRDAAGRISGVINLGIDVTKLRRLSASMNQIQENERRRIARELHDDLGQRLTALRINLVNVAADQQDERLLTMLALVDETLATVRRVATELRPSALDDFGFQAAIAHEVETFRERTGMNVTLSTAGNLDVGGQRATALYRIILEALTNTARHSGASSVVVRIERRDGRIEVEVRDNGRGITDAEARSSRTLGLLGIRERVHALLGEVTIEKVATAFSSPFPRRRSMSCRTHSYKAVRRV